MPPFSLPRAGLRTAAAALVALGALTALGTRAASIHELHHGGGEPTRDEPSAHGSASGPPPELGGEYAFATLAEIVALLRADPDTDWSAVDLPALREHLRDMSRVTLDADVESEPTERGATFRVTSDAPDVIRSIRRMTTDHARTMGDVAGWRLAVREIEGGVSVEAVGRDETTAAMVRALGFHGLLADGDHHRAHHWMLATGADPH